MTTFTLPAPLPGRIGGIADPPLTVLYKNPCHTFLGCLSGPVPETASSRGLFTAPRPDLRRLREFRPRVGALTLNVCTNEKHSGNKAPEFQEGSPNLVPGTAPVKPLFRNPVFFLGFILALGWLYFGFMLAPFWLHFGGRCFVR